MKTVYSGTRQVEIKYRIKTVTNRVKPVDDNSGLLNNQQIELFLRNLIIDPFLHQYNDLAITFYDILLRMIFGLQLISSYKGI